jgi:hypothetical protein
LNIPFKLIRDTYKDNRTAYEARMILVRPDQYVVWAGDAAPKDTMALMRKVVGV